jgi:hypothetical protein
MSRFKKLKISWPVFAQILFCCALFSIYLYKYQAHQIGADFLLRMTEARYFLAAINPYDVFMGIKPIISVYGPTPAVYSFFSYFFAGIFTRVTSDEQTQLLLFICLDFAALVAGVLLVNKMISSCLAQPSDLVSQLSKSWVLMLVLVCSTYFWQHVYFLNYTLLSIFGLLMVLWGLHKNLTLVPLVGMALIGLRPSLAIPVFVYLAVSKHWKLLSLAALEYLCVLLAASTKLQANPIDLVKQLSEVQRYFSDNLSYYHAEGILLIIKTQLGSYLTIVSTVVVAIIMIAYRKHLTNPLISLSLIITSSVSLFYTQVHAWISIYPILLIALSGIANRDHAFKKYSKVLVLVLISFLIVPRLSGYVSEDFRYHYLVFHNLLRFGALWCCVIYLIRQLIIAERTTVVGPYA